MKSLDEELESLGTTVEECSNRIMIDPVFSNKIKAIWAVLDEAKDAKWTLPDTAVLMAAVLENIDEYYQQ